MGELRINMGSSEGGESDKSTMPDELTADLNSGLDGIKHTRLVGRMGNSEIGLEPSPTLKKIYDRNSKEVIGDVESLEPSTVEGKYVVVVVKDGARLRMVLSQEQLDNQLELNK